MMPRILERAQILKKPTRGGHHFFRRNTLNATRAQIFGPTIQLLHCQRLFLHVQGPDKLIEEISLVLRSQSHDFRFEFLNTLK
jgi:hypothetical protein